MICTTFRSDFHVSWKIKNKVRVFLEGQTQKKNLRSTFDKSVEFCARKKLKKTTFCRLMTVELAWKSVEKKDFFLFIQNYALLFLSWMAFTSRNASKTIFFNWKYRAALWLVMIIAEGHNFSWTSFPAAGKTEICLCAKKKFWDLLILTIYTNSLVNATFGSGKKSC